jgi:hypothetical protein
VLAARGELGIGFKEFRGKLSVAKGRIEGFGRKVIAF